VVARTTEIASLGIDAERRGAVHRRLWRHIATDAELQWLESLVPARAADMAALVFSAKEAFFKCQFPLTREWLSFADVSVSVEPPVGRIRPRTARTGPRVMHVAPARRLALQAWLPPPWTGRYALQGALIVTGFGLRPRASLPSRENVAP
jgi:4'-phosphopantetheinyl transferase EntD